MNTKIEFLTLILKHQHFLSEKWMLFSNKIYSKEKKELVFSSEWLLEIVTSGWGIFNCANVFTARTVIPILSDTGLSLHKISGSSFSRIIFYWDCAIQNIPYWHYQKSIWSKRFYFYHKYFSSIILFSFLLSLPSSLSFSHSQTLLLLSPTQIF